MFETHTSERLPGSDMVTIVDPCASGARLRYFESPSVAATLKAVGFKWSIDVLLSTAQHCTSVEFQRSVVWGHHKKKYANQEFLFSCL